MSKLKQLVPPVAISLRGLRSALRSFLANADGGTALSRVQEANFLVLRSLNFHGLQGCAQLLDRLVGEVEHLWEPAQDDQLRVVHVANAPSPHEASIARTSIATIDQALWALTRSH